MSLAGEAPKITDWMQGWGNVLGVILSAIAVIYTARLFRHERNMRREEKEDGDLAQARLVVGRVSGYEINPDGTIAKLQYDITNYSDAPVFFVNPSVYYWDGSEDFDSGRVHHVLKSQATARGEVAIDAADAPDILDDDTPDLSQYQVKFLFIDKNGLEWRRFDYDTPIRGFKDPKPTWVQRFRGSVSDRFVKYRMRLKYGPWSNATRRRKRVAAARRRGASPVVRQRPVDLRRDEE